MVVNFTTVVCKELGEALNMKLITATAENPWSNSVCKRLNIVINLVNKIIADSECSLEISLFTMLLLTTLDFQQIS